MYEASDLFKKAISQQNRELRIRATIDGKEYSGWSEIQSCVIEESILTDEDFKFGGANAATIDLTLLNMDDSLTAKSFEGKEVHVEIGAMLEKFHQPFEYVSMGYFLVDRAAKEKSSIHLSGFDKMILFEQPYVTNLTYPATLKQILQEICTSAAVPLKTTSFVNDDYKVDNAPDLDGVTLRMGLEYVSELACGFARIDRDDALEIVTLTDTPIAIDKSNYYSMNLSEYEYGPIDYVVINNEGIIEDIGEGTSILEIKDNIFTFNEKGNLLSNIFNRVKNFRFKPFTATWQGNVLTAPGDMIDVSYKAGETYRSFIAKQKFNFANGLKCDIETNAKTQMQIDYQTQGSVTDSVRKTRASIKNLGSEIRLEVERLDGDIVEAYSRISLTADEIRAEVADVEKGLRSTISITASQIRSEVSAMDVRLSDGIAQNKSSITQTATQIRSEVSSEVKRIDGSLSSLSSSITQTATQIRSEVNSKVTELNGKITDTNSSITQTASSIRSEVNSKVTELDGKISSANSSITQTAESIRSEVNTKVTELDGKISTANSSITQLAGQVSIKADASTVDALGTRVTTAEWTVDAVAGQISSKVSYTDFTGERVVSMINQTPYYIEIVASKINLRGAVTVLSDISGNLGTITTGTIDIYQSASIGAGLYLRGQGNYTGIYFGSTQINQDSSGSLNINGGITSRGAFTEFFGSVDFSRANVTGLGGGGATTVRYSSASSRLYIDQNGYQVGYVDVK